MLTIENYGYIIINVDKVNTPKGEIRLRILALDQALTKTGFAIFDKELEKYGILNLGDIERDKTLTKEQKGLERINNVKEFMNRLIDTYDIELVVLEDVQSQKNVDTFKKLASLQGNLKLWLYEFGIPFAILKPSEWRQALGIKGSKREIQKKNAIDKINKLYGAKVTDDEADAICLALAAKKRLDKNKLDIIKEI